VTVAWLVVPLVFVFLTACGGDSERSCADMEGEYDALVEESVSTSPGADLTDRVISLDAEMVAAECPGYDQP